MTGGVVRRLVAGVARAIAALAGLWTAWLVIFGGFDLRWSGFAVTSHEPMRPLLITAVSLSMFMILGGDAAVTRWVMWAAAAVERRSVQAWTVSLPLRRRWAWWLRIGRLDRVLVGVLMLAAVIFGVVDGSKAAGGSDSYGYISEAELFVTRGLDLTVVQPWVADVPWPAAIWTFSPLGYKPAEPARVPGDGLPGTIDRQFRAVLAAAGYTHRYDPNAIVPTYSPGLPLLMAATKWVAGNSAMFWVVPLSGALFILATYGIGCRLGSARLGLVAAFLVATSPPVMGNMLVQMTDLPVASAWALAIWGLLGQSLASACGGALALGLALLIRPNLVPLLPIVVIWLALRVLRGSPHRWWHAGRGVVLLGGAAAGMACTAAIYWTTYGSPFESGYGNAAGYFSRDYLAPNVTSYTHQLVSQQTPLIFLGLAALLVPLKRLWPHADRSTVIVCALFTVALWGEFSIYLAGAADLRFLLPSYPFVMLGLASVILGIGRLPWRAAAPMAAVAAIVLCLIGVRFAQRHGMFNGWQEAISIQIGNEVRRVTPENSVVLSMQHSGVIRYYAGRVTMRWDNVAADWLDRSVDWLNHRGVSTYVLVDGWERDEMRKRFDGQALAKRLDEPPVFRLGDKRLYDLSSPPGAVPETTVIPLNLHRGLSQPPAPTPALIWKSR